MLIEVSDDATFNSLFLSTSCNGQLQWKAGTPYSSTYPNHVPVNWESFSAVQTQSAEQL